MPLPTVGGSANVWGTQLNEFLQVAHNADGTLADLPNNVKDYGATGDGVTDDRAAIQAAIDAVPAQGGVVYFPAGSYKINAVAGVGLNLDAKRVTLQGTAITTFNDSGEFGSQLICGSTNMTLVSVNGGAAVFHAGPQFVGLGFYSTLANCKLVRIAMTNHWGFDTCYFHGSGAGLIGLETEIPVATYPSGDNSYGQLLHCAFELTSATSIAYNAHDAGTSAVIACNFSGADGGYGIKATGVTAGLDVIACKFNYPVGVAGGMILLEAAHCHVQGCHFEMNDAATDQAAVYINRPAVPVVDQGQYNNVSDCQFVGSTGAQVAIRVGTDCAHNIMVNNVFLNVADDITYEGASQYYQIRSDQTETRLRGAVGFNGNDPVARPDYTVTNHSDSRSLNETSATLPQVANVLGTLIEDLRLYGLLQ